MPLSSFHDDNVDFDGKTILVTGGTGSFGTQFVRTVLERHSPSRLIVFSRDELKQYEMAQAFDGMGGGALRFFIGDVREQERLEMAMRGVDYVVHAAALKHVPTAEYNPFECIKTNVFGAENVVQAAIRSGVEKVVALSIDKAANPVNLYGASKLASDKIFVAANNLSGADGARFAAVRYGNVIGSRGSFVPLLRKLVAEGADKIPITDARMTRFWITLQQGVDFVLSCFGHMRGGEIFVPKIPSMRIVDLANHLAPGIPHEITGVRPGEKLHELMVTRDDARATIELEDRFIIEPSFAFFPREGREAEGAKQVAEDFKYASDTNTQWLDPGDLEKLLAETGS